MDNQVKLIETEKLDKGHTANTRKWLERPKIKMHLTKNKHLAHKKTINQMMVRKMINVKVKISIIIEKKEKAWKGRWKIERSNEEAIFFLLKITSLKLIKLLRFIYNYQV